jgi:hypothetical protein
LFKIATKKSKRKKSTLNPNRTTPKQKTLACCKNFLPLIIGECFLFRDREECDIIRRLFISSDKNSPALGLFFNSMGSASDRRRFWVGSHAVSVPSSLLSVDFFGL